MIITISGKPGAGKTTIGKLLSKELNYQFLSVGDLQGEIALKKGLTINQLMEKGKTDKSIHIEMDKKIETLGKERNNLIIEGWLAFHFIPKSFKIFLEVNESVGAKRIFNSLRPDEPKEKDIETTKERIEKRLKDTQISFKKYYNIDFEKKSNYDLTIDTSNLTPKEIVKNILNEINTNSFKE